MSDAYLTTGQIARELGVSARTVGLWIDRGQLRGIRLPSVGHREPSRRVARIDFETFRDSFGFMSSLVMLVGQSSPMDGVILAPSVFDAGILLSRRPRAIVVDWTIGVESAAAIVRGVRRLPGYAPLMVALHADAELAIRHGYSRTIGSAAEIVTLLDTSPLGG